VTATSAYLHDAISRYLDNLLDEQIEYHWKTSNKMSRLHRGLDHMGIGLLLASACLSATYVLFVFFRLTDVHHHGGFFAEWFKPFVTFSAAGFPALGAALYGIRAQGDYEATAMRSADTLQELLEVRRSLLLLATGPEPSFAAVRSEFSWASEVMQSDLTLWRSLYRSRPLTMLA
jgi:hypothetical protein